MIELGPSHNLADTAEFLALLNRPAPSLPPELHQFFSADEEIIITRAPGRLDLMGGIADYSGSLVLEYPIANATHAAIQRITSPVIQIVSIKSGHGHEIRAAEVPLEDFLSTAGPIEYSRARHYFRKRPDNHWAAYVAGAFLVLMREAGAEIEGGAKILLASDVPEGKGVSSSAALEVAIMQAVAVAYGIELPPRNLAFLCQKVENSIAGAPCGVMDQMTSACGEAERLLAILCQPGELKGTVEIPDDLALWGIDSGIRHSIGGADYGTVRTAAFMGYRIIAEMAGLSHRANRGAGHVEVDDPKWHGYLANITPQEFSASYAQALPRQISGAEFLKRYAGITDSVTSVNPAKDYPVYQATRHPINENERVNRFVELLDNDSESQRGQLLGELMYQAHKGYSDCGLGSEGTDEIVRIVHERGSDKGLFGAKITGGGSGGIVAVLGSRDAGPAVHSVATEYRRRSGHKAMVISGSSPGSVRFGHLRLRREVA